MTPLIGSLVGGGAAGAAGGATGADAASGEISHGNKMSGKDVKDAFQNTSEIARDAQKGQMDALKETTKAGTPTPVQGQGDRTTGRHAHASKVAEATSSANADPNAPRATSG